jgi:hypothetical protein
MPAHVYSGEPRPGGILGYPLHELGEEVAFISYYFHWSHADIMNMEHADRRDWAARISDLNRRESGE